MQGMLYLTTVLIGRILLSLLVVAIIYNPWLSLYGWLTPESGTGAPGFVGDWLVKLIATAVMAGLLILFARTTHKALGAFGLVFVLGVLLLIGYVPFYFGWLAAAPASAFRVFYFGIVPVLLGIGLSAGYINRYLAGTLQTAPLGGHHGHVAEARQETIHTTPHHG